MSDKNKDLVFSSDEVMEKEKKRKILIYACIGLAVLATILAIILIIKGNTRGSYQGGEGTIYPYGWQEKKNGTVRLVVDRTAAPAYDWVVEGYDQDAGNHMVQVEAPEKQGKNSSEFTFQPQTEGREAVTLILTDAEGFSRLGELNLMLEVTQDGKKLLTSIVGHSLSVYFEPVRGGQDTAYPYALTMDENGYLVLMVWDENLVYTEEVLLPDEYIQRAEESAKKAEAEVLTEEQVAERENAPADESYTSDAYFDWKGRSDQEDVLAYLGLHYEEKLVKAYFRPAAVGGAQIHLYTAVGGYEITAEVAVTGSHGTLSVESHGLQGYDASEEETTEVIEEEEGEETVQDTPAGKGKQESADGSSSGQ